MNDHHVGAVDGGRQRDEGHAPTLPAVVRLSWQVPLTGGASRY